MQRMQHQINRCKAWTPSYVFEKQGDLMLAFEFIYTS